VHVLAAGLFGLHLVACGGSADSEEARVAAVIAKLQEDLAEGRISAVCAAISDRSKRQVGSVGHQRKPTTCRADLGDLVRASRSLQGSTIKGLGETAAPDVLGIAIPPDGGTASVTMTLGERPFRVPFVREKGSWKLDDFFGATARPPADLR